MLRCPYCRNDIDKKNNVCIYCGGDISNGDINLEIQSNEKRKKLTKNQKIIRTLVLLWAVVAPIGCCLFFYLKLFPSETLPDIPLPDIPGKLLLVIDDDIYIANANGTNITNLTKSPNRIDMDPKFSPDKDKIAYISQKEGYCGSLFIMDISGKNNKNITDHLDICISQFDTMLMWTQNGDGIILIQHGYIINTKKPTEFIELIVDRNNRLHCSPNGYKCLFRNNLEWNYWEVSNNEITKFPVDFSHTLISWSPDNTRILYDKEGDTKELYIYDTELNNERLLVTYSEYIKEAIWSPDGSMIAYVGSDGNLELINSDGTNNKRINKEKLFASYIYWSPDSNYILAKTMGVTAYEIISTIDYEVTAINKSSMYLWYSGWSPDSEWVIYNTATEDGWGGYVDEYVFAFSLEDRESIKIHIGNWEISDLK